MAIIKKEMGNHQVYEFAQEGTLVAIEREDQSNIKKFWKKYKGKSNIPDDTVKGYPFVLDEEHDSLKIDFTEKKEFEIRGLKKFD
jgi:hypothetical protein